MGICDIVIIALLVLSGIIGFVKGFFKRLAGFLAFVGAIIVAFLLYKAVVNILSNTGLYSMIDEKLLDWFASKSEAFSTTMGELGEEGIQTAIGSLGIPAFIRNFLLKDLGTIIENNPDVTLGTYLATLLTNFALIAISFLIIFILALIILRIVFGFFKKLSESKTIGTLDRILGLAWGLVRTLITICLIMSFLSFIVSVPGIGDKINEFITSDMKLEEEGFGLAKYFYLQNPLMAILSKYGLSDLISYPVINSDFIVNVMF